MVPVLCGHRSLVECADENMHWYHSIKGSCSERCLDGVVQVIWLGFYGFRALEKHRRNSAEGRSIWKQFKQATGKSLKVKNQLGSYYKGWTTMTAVGTQISFFLLSLTFDFSVVETCTFLLNPISVEVETLITPVRSSKV